MTELKVSLEDPRRYVMAVSGLFYNHETGVSLTPDEIRMIVVLMRRMKNRENAYISQDDRIALARLLEINIKALYKRITNLRHKRVVDAEGRLHKLFLKGASVQIICEYGTREKTT